MRLALWLKAIRDARWLLVGCVLVMFAFLWIRVWIHSTIRTSEFSALIDLAMDTDMGQQFNKLLPIPVEQLKSIQGRIGMGLVFKRHAVTAADCENLR